MTFSRCGGKAGGLFFELPSAEFEAVEPRRVVGGFRLNSGICEEYSPGGDVEMISKRMSYLFEKSTYRCEARRSAN